MTNPTQGTAFVLRIAPSGIDRMQEALRCNQLIIGWAKATGLLDGSLSWESFREIIRLAYHAGERDLRGAGRGAGNMWRFIRDMHVGDLVVVPYGSAFYLARVTGPATYDPAHVNDDTAYRRRVEWLNNGHPIPRQLARSALLARMKIQGTSAQAADLLEEINECLKVAERGNQPTFEQDLQARLIREVLEEMRSGRISDFGFERLIQTVLTGMGAEDVRIVPRNQDKGADLVATFRVAEAFEIVIAIQAKHWQPSPPVGKDVIAQTISGIEAEEADFGMVITTGTFSADAEFTAESYFKDEGVRIRLIDGEQFAKFIVEHGIRLTLGSEVQRR
ncbi:MAG: restriction endonuclease [Phycisphaerales bacterium]|nr:restriction endonuclease [Phycisphaerales bacterium]